MHRRVDVTEFPFVGGQLAVRVHRPFPAHQHQLFLGEIRVDMRQRDRVERQIPGREPGVLPFVRHRDDVGERQLTPVPVARATALAGIGRRRFGGVALDPFVDVVPVELLAPEQARVGAAGDVPVRVGQRRVDDGGVELVGLPFAIVEDRLELGAEGGLVRRLLGQPQPDLRRSRPARSGPRSYQNAALVPDFAGLIALVSPLHDPVVDAVLGVLRRVLRGAEQVDHVGLVVAEQHLRRALGGQVVVAEQAVLALDGLQPADRQGRRQQLVQGAAPPVPAPRPGVAQPDLRQQVQRRGLRRRGWSRRW